MTIVLPLAHLVHSSSLFGKYFAPITLIRVTFGRLPKSQILCVLSHSLPVSHCVPIHNNLIVRYFVESILRLEHISYQHFIDKISEMIVSSEITFYFCCQNASGVVTMCESRHLGLGVPILAEKKRAAVLPFCNIIDF